MIPWIVMNLKVVEIINRKLRCFRSPTVSEGTLVHSSALTVS